MLEATPYTKLRAGVDATFARRSANPRGGLAGRLTAKCGAERPASRPGKPAPVAYEPPRPAVICDVDGEEAKIIDPARVGWLRDAMLLVEVHESLSRGVTSTLCERLAETHRLEWIEPSARYLANPEHRMLWSLRLSPVQQRMLISELRIVRTPWLWATPL